MRILVLPGDGIGPEITAATMAVLERANAARGLGLEFEHDVAGFASLERHGSTFRDELAGRFPSHKGVILDPNDGARCPPCERGGADYSALAEPATRTAEPGGSVGTAEFGDAVAASLG